MHYLFLIPLIGGALLVASTVDGERLLSTESQSLEFRSGYPNSRSPLPRDCQPLWSIYHNGSTLLLPWSCLSSTSYDQPLLCPQCLGGENSLRHEKRPFLKRTDVFLGSVNGGTNLDLHVFCWLQILLKLVRSCQRG